VHFHTIVIFSIFRSVQLWTEGLNVLSLLGRSHCFHSQRPDGSWALRTVILSVRILIIVRIPELFRFFTVTQMYTYYIVPYMLKARTVKPTETTVARKQQDNNT
jgi:hypothetical protein